MLLRLADDEIAGLSTAQLMDRLAAMREANIRAAVDDSCDFVDYALPDEETGEPVESQWFHREWHEHIDDHRLSVILAPVEHAKSSSIAVGKVLHRIGKNPNLRCAIISNGEDSAQKPLRAIRAHIERNARVREVFPHLVPSTHPEAPWGESAITVERSRIMRDPTLQALGVGGQIVGSRLDLIVLDDVLDFKNTLTAEQCAKTVHWFETTVLTRLTANGRIIVIGTPWAASDLLAVLQTRVDWAAKIYSAVENPDDSAEKWRPIWPQRWPIPRLLERLRTTTTLTFWRKYMCRITSDATSRFAQEWIDTCRRLGIGRSFLRTQPTLHPQGTKLKCFTGVDLGMSPRKRRLYAGIEHGEGLTVFFTIAIDPRARRVICEIDSGRWKAPAIIDKLASIHARFDSTIAVEDNGAQAFLVQWAQTRMIPIVEHTTTSLNKYDESYGVETIGVEMRNGLWVFPSGPKGDGFENDGEMRKLEAKLLQYTPDGHTADEIMAMWIAREAARALIAEVMATINTTAR